MKKFTLILLGIFMILLIAGCAEEEAVLVSTAEEVVTPPQDAVAPAEEKAPPTEPLIFRLDEVDVDFCKHNKCSLLLAVDNNIYNEISTESNTFKEDLERDVGYEIIIKTYAPTTDKSIIKRDLVNFYKNNNLRGVYFIGDLPYAEFLSQTNILGTSGLDTFPSDYYYIDIYDKCGITNQGIYYNKKDSDIKEMCNPSMFRTPFWISRIKSENVQDIKNYFIKNHQFRTGQLSYSNKILLWYPASPKEDLANTNNQINTALGRYNSFADNEIIKAELSGQDSSDLRLKLQNNYFYAFLNTHGTAHQMTPDLTYDNVKSNPLFVEIRSCSVGDFSKKKIIADAFLFEGDTLLVTAPTYPTIGGSVPSAERTHLYKIGVPPSDLQGQVFDVSLISSMFGDPTISFAKNKKSQSSLFVNLKEIDLGKISITRPDLSLQEWATKIKEIPIKLKNNGDENIYYHFMLRMDLSENSNPVFDNFGYMASKDFIAPGEVMEIPLTFEAKKIGQFRGVIYVITSDINYPLAQIPFYGEAVA